VQVHWLPLPSADYYVVTYTDLLTGASESVIGFAGLLVALLPGRRYRIVVQAADAEDRLVAVWKEIP
jgi:hypothetical protein